MPKRTTRSHRSSTRAAPRSLKRRRGRTVRRRTRVSNIHTFKGVLNAGELFGIPTTTSTHLGGQFIMTLSDLPMLGTGAGGVQGLGQSFDYVRFNKCKMEFMPRYNVSDGQIASNELTTFMTALNQTPMGKASGGTLTVAPSWGTQADEDSTVTETRAYDHPNITPDYLRGMPSCKETQIYKKHTVWFTPCMYSYLTTSATNNSVAPFNNIGVYTQLKNKWVNLITLNQSSGAESQSLGPDFYGPVYCFGQNVATIETLYDVKVHYSVSFKGFRGI